MLTSLSPCTLALVLSLAFEGLAVPNPSTPSGLSMQLGRRNPTGITGDWAKNNLQLAETKYGSPPSSRLTVRAAGTNLIVNQLGDSAYYGSIAIGTPPVAYNILLDTGSADLWVAGKGCATSSSCSGIPTFDSSVSSSFSNLSQPFSIKYGSGSASGVLVQDTVQMASFGVAKQTFAICNSITRNLLTTPVSGLLGLAFQSISTSGAKPFWQQLVESGAWDSPVMAFQFTRFVDSSRELNPGGTFTMGFVNTSLYSGDIDFQNIPNGDETYWILPLTSLTVQGSTISLGNSTSSRAAIDTGTTLVGGPPAVIAAMYAEIPGAQAATGDYENYFFVPCDTKANVTMTFGGRSWTINPEDFTLQVDGSQCMGAFFQLSTAGSTPAWIVGDTFLKNVYSVFRYNPPSIGFATLSDVANAMDSENNPVPTPTVGSVSTQITASGSRHSFEIPLSMGLAATAISLIAGVLTGVQ